jgi:hypothetical protein
MIPIALPSAGFFILLISGFLAGWLLLGLAVVLAVSSRARSWARRHTKSSTLIGVVLVVPFGFYVWFRVMLWQVQEESARRQAALHVTLTQQTDLGHVVMPAGTRLQLEVEGQLESYVEANFPQPVTFFGMAATSVRRYLDTQYEDGTVAALGRHPHTVILRGVGQQTVEGWHCDAAQDIAFNVARDRAHPMLDQCVLASGNRAADLALTPGDVVHALDGTVYTDGSRDADRWRIAINADKAVPVFGLFLGQPHLYLDADRKLLRVDGAELVCPARFGGVSYAAGTQVMTVRRGFGDAREPSPGVLVFTPRNGQPAKRAGSEDVPEGMSVIQTLQGQVIDVVKSETVGAFNFATFTVGDEAPPTPPRAACP